MSQATLIEKIKADAALEVAAIKAAGAVQVEAIVRETEAALASLRSAHHAVEEKKLAQLELAAVARAKQAGKLAVQAAKRTAIDELFADVEQALIKLSAEEYVATFAKHAAAVIPAGVTVTAVRAPQDRLAETKQILAAQGIVGDISPDDTIKAGFMLHATDGAYDVTLTRLLDERRTALEMEVMTAVMS